MEQLEATEERDEDREEETVDEKIDRLRTEIDDLYEEAERLRNSSPPITRPPMPGPLLQLRRAIKEKDTERELLLEEQRASKVVDEYLQENPSILDSLDECPICLEPIFDVGGASDFICCGKVVCRGCAEPLMTSANTCPLCRERFPREGESLPILRTKAAAGNAWAQCNLGNRYYDGASKLAVGKGKAESLLRSAADQGHSDAQYQLGVIERQRNNVSEAGQLYEAAASQGHMGAVGRLGIHYFAGEGVEEDVMKAVRLLTVSSKLQTSDRSAHQTLAGCFARGEGGLEQSMVRAAYYMKPAIEDTRFSSNTMIEYAFTLYGISICYYPESRIPPSGDNNLPEALFWFCRANSNSINPQSAQFLESYESKIKEFCASCYEPLSTDKPMCCIECKAVYYCSRECQAADWRGGHKKDCVKSLKKRLRATGMFENVV